jgi:hypothetical protein
VALSSASCSCYRQRAQRKKRSEGRPAARKMW